MLRKVLLFMYSHICLCTITESFPFSSSASSIVPHSFSFYYRQSTIVSKTVELNSETCFISLDISLGGMRISLNLVAGRLVEVEVVMIQTDYSIVCLDTVNDFVWL